MNTANENTVSLEAGAAAELRSAIAALTQAVDQLSTRVPIHDSEHENKDRSERARNRRDRDGEGRGNPVSW